MNRLRSESGVTILELTIAMSVGTLIVSLVASVLSFTTWLPAQRGDTAAVAEDVQNAERWIVRDGNSATTFAAGSGATYGTFSWSDYTGADEVDFVVSYAYDSANGYLVRTEQRNGSPYATFAVERMVASQGDVIFAWSPSSHSLQVSLTSTANSFNPNTGTAPTTRSATITVTLRPRTETTADTPVPVATATATAVLANTPTATTTPTGTATGTATATVTPTLTATPTATPTGTATPTASATATSTNTATPTSTPTPASQVYFVSADPTLLTGSYVSGGVAQLQSADGTYYVLLSTTSNPRQAIYTVTSQSLTAPSPAAAIQISFTGQASKKSVTVNFYVQDSSSGFPANPAYTFTIANANQNQTVTFNLPAGALSYVNSLADHRVNVKVSTNLSSSYSLSTDQITFTVTP